jgi:hypothetical protein
MTRSLLALFVLVVAMGGCATPESVVRQAVAASERGDQAAYEACFTPRSRSVLRTVRRAAGPLNFGASSGRIEVSARPGGPLAWGRRIVDITDGERQIQLVLRGDAGAWRIDLIDTERRAAAAGGRP